jgi:LPS sulfotransferase NodH
MSVREQIPVGEGSFNAAVRSSRSQPKQMKPPVFIVGSPRSGTTLLYHMLLSAGGFAVYLTESKVFDLVFPQFPNLNSPENRRKALDLWLQSKLFTLTDLEKSHIERRILEDCRSGGDFLRIVMEEMALQQNVNRWAENTPEHILHLDTIKKEIPDALVIHMIRDGRDVALSLHKKGWVQPFPWGKKRGALVAGLYWEWLLDKGREYHRRIGRDYLEVRYEQLVSQPVETLAQISRFIDHDLDYQQIQRVGIGSVSEPNTSFEGESSSGTFDPVGRWRKGFAAGELGALEELIGPTLENLGYPVTPLDTSSAQQRTPKAMRTAYRIYWDFKLWLKMKTPLGRVLVKADPADL